jgi:hypothetical protein
MDLEQTERLELYEIFPVDDWISTLGKKKSNSPALGINYKVTKITYVYFQIRFEQSENYSNN